MTRDSMRIRIFLSLLFVFAVAPSLCARLVRSWTDQEIFEKADLVVIANVVSIRNTGERSTLTDLTPPVKVTGVEADLETCLTLKGPKSITKFRLHYYATHEQLTNGPFLVEIPQDKHPAYLLFLVKESDGSYVPATGQTDPAMTSVFRIRAATGPSNARPDPVVGTGFLQPETYQKMFDKADLVVMAGWAGTKETDERTTLPGFKPSIKVIGLTTEFETQLVFKGPKDIKNVGLHHYKFQSPDDDLWNFAPQFVRIRGPQRRDGDDYPGGGQLILFLKKERDSRYAPVTGQIYPAVSSVLMLDFPVD